MAIPRTTSPTRVAPKRITKLSSVSAGATDNGAHSAVSPATARAASARAGDSQASNERGSGTSCRPANPMSANSAHRSRPAGAGSESEGPATRYSRTPAPSNENQTRRSCGRTPPHCRTAHAQGSEMSSNSTWAARNRPSRDRVREGGTGDARGMVGADARKPGAGRKPGGRPKPGSCGTAGQYTASSGWMEFGERCRPARALCRRIGSANSPSLMLGSTSSGRRVSGLGFLGTAKLRSPSHGLVFETFSAQQLGIEQIAAVEDQGPR